MRKGFSSAELSQLESTLALRKLSFMACPKGLPALELLTEYLNADRRVKGLHRFDLTPLKVTYFDNNERLPTIMDSVRDRNVIISQSFTQGEDPKEIHLSGEVKDLEWSIATARESGAEKISLDMDFFPYGRSDKKFKGGQAILAKAFIRGLEAQAGNKAGRIFTYDLHNEAIEGFCDTFTMDALSAAPLFALHFRNLPELEGVTPVVVAPDAGGVKRAEDFSNVLGADFAYIHKRREQGQKAKVKQLIGDVKGRVCIVIDDMISGGGTATGIAEVLYDRGATLVYFAATHCLFVKKPGEPTPEEQFRNYKVKVVGMDSVFRSPEFLEQNKDWFTMLTSAGHKSDIMLGHYFGDKVRNIRKRYDQLSYGEIKYDSEGKLQRMFAGRSIARQGISYATIDDLRLPNPAYLRAWQRAEEFKRKHNLK